MPNPTFPNDRGPCQECKSYGGPYEPESKWGATICTNERGSGKRVSRIPEVGCSAFARMKPPLPKR